MTTDLRKTDARVLQVEEQAERELAAPPSNGVHPVFDHAVLVASTAKHRSMLNQDELQAATHATLRAHATSDEAKALVAKLAAMVEDHGISAGSRKNRRRGTAGKLEYASGAFLANLLRALSVEVPEPNGWVYRSMHAKSFTGKAVKHRTFKQLVDGLTELDLIKRVAGHRVSSEQADVGKFAARFRATPALLKLCNEHGVEPINALDHFEFEYDLPKHP